MITMELAPKTSEKANLIGTGTKGKILESPLQMECFHAGEEYMTKAEILAHVPKDNHHWIAKPHL